MFCNQCGKELPDDAAFCSGCGNQINVAGGNAAETTTAETVAESAGAGFTANAGATKTEAGSKTVTVSVDLSKFEKRYFVGNVDFVKFDANVFLNQVIENVKYNWIALACCAVMFINVFLPYGMVNFFGLHAFNLLSAGGGIFILFSVAAAVLACFRMSIPLLGVGCLSVLVSLVKVIQFFVSGNGITIPSIGFFLMILSSLALTAAPFVTKYVLKKD